MTVIRGKRGDLVISKDGYTGIILAVERNKTIVFMGNSLRMVCDPEDLQIIPIIMPDEVVIICHGIKGRPSLSSVKGAPSNFYELLPVHYDDAPHDFRIKQLEMEDEIKRSFEEIEKSRLAFRLLVDDLAESKRIGEEVIARLSEAYEKR